MREVTATVLARQLREILDHVEHRGEEIMVVRNNHKIARILPGPGTMSALEALSDLYRSLPKDAASDWIKDSRGGPMGEKLKPSSGNPWDI